MSLCQAEVPWPCLPAAASQLSAGFTACVAIPSHPFPPSSCPLLPCYALIAPQAGTLTGPRLFRSLSVSLVLQECRTWTGRFEQRVEQMEAGPWLWPGGGSTQQAEAGHGKLRRGSWLRETLLPLHLMLKQLVSMAFE